MLLPRQVPRDLGAGSSQLTIANRDKRAAFTIAFIVRIGDSVLLKSPEQGKDWVGLICDFSETDEDDEEEMCAHIQWFCSPEELSSGKRGRQRPDFLPNEQFITADFYMNPLTAINGRAIVLSTQAYFAKYPDGKPAPRISA